MMTRRDSAAAALLGVVRPLGNSSDFSLIKGIGGVPRWLGGGGAAPVKYIFGNEKSFICEFPAAVTTVRHLTDRWPTQAGVQVDSYLQPLSSPPISQRLQRGKTVAKGIINGRLDRRDAPVCSPV